MAETFEDAIRKSFERRAELCQHKQTLWNITTEGRLRYYSHKPAITPKTAVEISLEFMQDPAYVAATAALGLPAHRSYAKQRKPHAAQKLTASRVSTPVAAAGFIYILSNVAMPNMVKIGRTAFAVERRVEELFNSSVPTPFVIEYSVAVTDQVGVEKLMHRIFTRHRINESREFFAISVIDAVAKLKEITEKGALNV